MSFCKKRLNYYPWYYMGGAGIGDDHFIVPGYGRVMAESGGSNGGTEILSNLSLHRFTTSYGANGSHNNMPPYYCVNIWRRTA